MKNKKLFSIIMVTSFVASMTKAEVLQTPIKTGDINTPKIIEQSTKEQQVSVDSYDFKSYGSIIDANEFNLNANKDEYLYFYEPQFIYKNSYLDRESNLNYMKSRYQSPILMRFIAQDNQDLINRYAYGNGDPINNFDPTGHISIGIADFIPWYGIIENLIKGNFAEAGIDYGIMLGSELLLAGTIGVIAKQVMKESETVIDETAASSREKIAFYTNTNLPRVSKLNESTLNEIITQDGFNTNEKNIKDYYTLNKNKFDNSLENMKANDVSEKQLDDAIKAREFKVENKKVESLKELNSYFDNNGTIKKDFEESELFKRGINSARPILESKKTGTLSDLKIAKLDAYISTELYKVTKDMPQYGTFAPIDRGNIQLLYANFRKDAAEILFQKI